MQQATCLWCGLWIMRHVQAGIAALLTKSSHRWMPGVFLTSSGLFDLDMPPSYSACFTLCTGQSGCAVTL